MSDKTPESPETVVSAKPDTTGPDSADMNKTGVKTVVSPLNGARLPVGAHPGNTGGKPGRSGRPPSAIRKALRESFDNRVHLLEEIADDGSNKDKLQALELMGRYGLGPLASVNADDIRDKVIATLDVIRQLCPPDLAARVVNALRPIWAGEG